VSQRKVGEECCELEAFNKAAERKVGMGWRKALRKLGKGVLGTVGGIGVGVTGLYNLDEGSRRQIIFWKGALPIFVHYRWTERQVSGLSEYEQSLAFNVLHDLYATEVHDLTLSLQGFFLKNAQLVSTRDDFVPPQYLAWCKQMCDQVPSELSDAEARRLVEQRLGVGDIFDVFSEWVASPVAAASIGQVHKARLRSTGEYVAVKVQYPGMEAKFRSDIATVIRFCRLAMPQHVAGLEQIEKHFDTEFDYTLEAQNLRVVGDNVNAVFGKRVVVPRPIASLCRPEVLVMEWLDGEKLDSAVKRQYERIAARQGKTLAEFEAEHRRKLETGVSELHSLEQEQRTHTLIKIMLRVSDVVRNVGALMYNSTLGWLPWTPVLSYHWSEMPVNLSSVLKLLLQVHAHEMLIDGAFNADPHPGNIMLLTNGKLGLVDYGQVKHVDKPFRKHYARLQKALLADDKAEVVRIAREDLGLKTKYSKDDVTYRYMAFWHDRDTQDVTQGLNLQAFQDEMEALDPLAELSGDLVMATRVSVLLRGMGLAFGVRLKFSECIDPVVEQALELWRDVE
jgi:aarF domain-containing kinase